MVKQLSETLTEEYNMLFTNKATGKNEQQLYFDARSKKITERGDWPLLNELPQGWAVDKTCGSQLTGYVFVTNRKSVLNGQKRGLLLVRKPKN